MMLLSSLCRDPFNVFNAWLLEKGEEVFNLEFIFGISKVIRLLCPSEDVRYHGSCCP